MPAYTLRYDLYTDAHIPPRRASKEMPNKNGGAKRGNILICILISAIVQDADD